MSGDRPPAAGLAKALEQSIREGRERVIEQQARRVLEVQKELVAHAMERGQAYSRVILAGGYAGYFALWAFVRDYLGAWEALTSALLLALSLAVYIFYTAISNIWLAGKQNIDATLLLRGEKDPASFLARWDEVQKKRQDAVIRASAVWRWVLFATIVPAALGTILLMYAMLERLVWEVWPF